MLSTFFSLIVFPTILAFFLGFAAYGLKIMTATTGDGSDGGGTENNTPEPKELETKAG